jgi:hypothetical protein
VAKLPVAAAALTTGASAVVEILFQEVAAGICRAKHTIIQYRILLYTFLNWYNTNNSPKFKAENG